MRDKIRYAYVTQKCNAKRRGIDWQFTFEEWLAWWGDDIVNRGCRKGQLVMSRFNDTGAYHPNNCCKLTQEENAFEGMKGRIKSAETKAKLSQANIGKTLNAEHRQKIAESVKRYWATQSSLNTY